MVGRRDSKTTRSVILIAVGSNQSVSNAITRIKTEQFQICYPVPLQAARFDSISLSVAAEPLFCWLEKQCNKLIIIKINYKWGT